MSMNAYIITDDGINGFAGGKPFTATPEHQNYDAIIDAIKAKNYDIIHDLINQSKMIAEQMVACASAGRITIDAEAGVILYDGHEIHNTLVNHIFRCIADGFDTSAPIRLLENILENPSKQTIDRIFDWVEACRMPITEDGYIVAFKRVQHDMTSFYDRKTMHTVGKETSFPRYLCDDNNHNTCSAGLHFCSQSYLPSYCGGDGRVLVLKIHPKDIVAIPYEYGTAKGRACNYLVMSELEGQSRKQVETSNPLTTAVIETDTVDQVTGATVEYIKGYIDGYNDGKDKMPMLTDDLVNYPMPRDAIEGYNVGYKDGRGHKGRKFKPADLTGQLPS